MSGYAPLPDVDTDKPTDLSAPPPARKVFTPRQIAIEIALIIGAFFFFTSWPASRAPADGALPGLLGTNDTSSPLPDCPSGLPPPAYPPTATNPWAALTLDESVAVHRWLHAPERALNLTLTTNCSLSDNVLYHVEAFRPPKAAALAYLAGEGPAPERWARATVHHGAAETPVIRDYLVGPLPVGNGTKLERLESIYHRPEIPFHARGFVSMNDMGTLLADTMTALAPVTEDLLGGAARGLPNDTLMGAMVGPFSFDGSFRRGWVSWRRNAPGPWLHPTNFFQYVDVSGTDTRQFKVLKTVYNHQVFNSTSAFLAAYHSGTLKRLPSRPDQDPSKSDYSWSTRARPKGAPIRDLDHLPGPRSVAFGGARFRLDRARGYVSWMGWALFTAFDRDMGLSLWDVRFRGARIAYEIAPQDALAQYAGNDPMQTTTAWLDRYFGMGLAVRDLLPGYDCPHGAAYLSATSFGALGYVVRKRAVCVFEQDVGRPITRHTGYQEGEFGAAKGYVLVVRSVSTVGNYDYRARQFDYIFQLDGTIEVRVSASGYLQGGYWEPRQEGYGTAIQATTMGSLHDHVINFKVDLDIAGTSNSLLRTSTAQEKITQPWFDDDWGSEVLQQRITRTLLTSEDDARLRYPQNFQGHYSIVNTEEKNKWGSPRGYAVHPGYSPVHNTVVGSKRLLKNANWAKYNLAVSVRKETEPSSSTMWNLNLPGDPTVDFDKFFDGENITQTDLVAWINVGMHHIPQAEDAPNTRTNTATSSFFLTPLNYFDADPSVDAANAVLLRHPTTPGARFDADEYGVREEHCLPAPVEKFVYEGVTTMDLDGREMVGVSAEELRKEAELFHRIKVEL